MSKPPSPESLIGVPGWLVGETIDFLQVHLAAVVPLMIFDLEHQGGISSLHIEALQKRRHGRELSHDEAVLYAVGKLTAQMIHELCEELAIMSFLPGGVKFGVLHFEGKPVYMEE